MASERWHQIERLYHEALEHRTDSRAAFVAKVCEGDEALRREVESLLAAGEGGEAFLEKPAIEVAANAQAWDATRGNTEPMPSVGWTRGARIGPYEALEPIGAGGMGEVWKARDSAWTASLR